ncbi:hypothetical protein JL722_787 [Aureococcus anophagefferens]|nr:hypothetical protein JL722_787 [Aureococcus anophagefferens]
MRASTVCTMAVGTPAAAEKKAATDKENDDALLAVATLTRTPILITDHVEADAAVTEIVTALQQPGARKVIAVDCEWIGEQKLGADVVQIAASTGPLYGPAQTSNWKQALDADQLAYAALDVEVTVAIHAALIALPAPAATPEDLAELAAATARKVREPPKKKAKPLPKGQKTMAAFFKPKA